MHYINSIIVSPQKCNPCQPTHCGQYRENPSTLVKELDGWFYVISFDTETYSWPFKKSRYKDYIIS